MSTAFYLAVVDHDPDLVVEHQAVFHQLCSQTAQNREAQLFLEDGCPLCALAYALDVLPPAGPCAEASSSEASAVQVLQKHRLVGHETRRLLDGAPILVLLA